MPRRLFSGENGVPGICITCNSPVEVFLRAAGAFVFGKNDVPGIFRTCGGPVEVFLRAAGPFFSSKSDSQMALAIFVMGEGL